MQSTSPSKTSLRSCHIWHRVTWSFLCLSTIFGGWECPHHRSISSSLLGALMSLLQETLPASWCYVSCGVQLCSLPSSCSPGGSLWAKGIAGAAWALQHCHHPQGFWMPYLGSPLHVLTSHLCSGSPLVSRCQRARHSAFCPCSYWWIDGVQIQVASFSLLWGS